MGARLMGERYEAVRERKETTPAVIVLPELADKLLGGKGKYKKYLGKVAKDPALVSGATDNVITLRTGKMSRKQDAKNVVGVIEGSDPKLKVV